MKLHEVICNLKRDQRRQEILVLSKDGRIANLEYLLKLAEKDIRELQDVFNQLVKHLGSRPDIAKMAELQDRIERLESRYSGPSVN